MEETFVLPWGYLTESDEDILAKYSKGKKNVVELGILLGRSTCILAEQAEHVTAIDIFVGKPIGDNVEHYNDLYSYEQVSAFMAKWRPNVTVRQGDSCQFAGEYSNVDLIFIDAGHLYYEVKQDFEAWYPKIMKDGLIIFHDYGNGHVGIDQFVDEIFTSGLVEKVFFFAPTMVVKKV